MQKQAVLTIAGSDSGGGAGIQADLKTFEACGVFGTSVITAITAQNCREVRHIHPIPLDAIEHQIVAVLDDFNIKAIKIGMLGDSDTVTAVAKMLAQYAVGIPIILDPVMVAKSGDHLLHADAVESIRRYFCPLATLITPNIPEAMCLLSHHQVDHGAYVHMHKEDMLVYAKTLFNDLGVAVLLKGGHGDEDIIHNIFYDGHQEYDFVVSRTVTPYTHGTGCTLSSSIAAFLASGKSIQDAVKEGVHYVASAIMATKHLKDIIKEDIRGDARFHGPLCHDITLSHSEE